MIKRLAGSPAAVTSAALALSSGTNFFAIMVWTRILTPEAFGVYALISACALLLNAIFFEWLRQTSARVLFDGSHKFEINPNRANAIVTIYVACIAILIIVCSVIWILDVDIEGVSGRFMPLLVLFTITEMALGFVNTVSRLRMESWQYFWSIVGRSILSLGLGFSLVFWFDGGAVGAILGIVIAQGVVFFSGIVLDPFWRTLKLSRVVRAELMDALRLGYPLILSCALMAGAGVIDRFLIASQLGAAEIGHYTAPVDILQKTLVFVMMAINLTAYPVVVRAYENAGLPAATAAMSKNFVVQLGLGLPAALGLAVLAPGVAAIFLGEAYRSEASEILPIISIAALLKCVISYQLVMAFQITKRMKTLLVPPIVTLVVISITAPFAMREWGLAGMALSSTISQLFSFIVTLVLAKKAMRVKLITADTIKISVSALIMAFSLYFFRDRTGVIETFMLIVVGGFLYLGSLCVLRADFIFSKFRLILNR